MDSEAWDARYAAADLVWSIEPNQFVARECEDLTPGRALDLAAGEGRNAIWLAQRGWEVTAVDFSQVALEKGRRLAAGIPIEWVCRDVLEWTADQEYDLAVLAYLQLPAPERRRAVRTAYDALRPGGTLLLVAHDSTNLAEGTGGPQDPAVLMTAEDVLGDLHGAAYDVLHAGRVARVVAPDEGHGGEPARTAWDCLVRIRKAPSSSA